MICYLPIDVPKIPYDENYYWWFFNKYKKTGHGVWDTVTLMENHYTQKMGMICSAVKYLKNGQWYWKDNVKQYLPELIAFIEALPLRYLGYVSIFSNNDFVKPHHDLVPKTLNSPVVQRCEFKDYDWTGYNFMQNEYANECKDHEPSSYRIILAGDRATSFFVCSKTTPENRIYGVLPETTDTFAFNTTGCLHGADKNENKLLVFISGWLDFEKHDTLVKQSIQKYKSNTIIL
ncbi:MAG: hypothetical protein HC836_22710 [Richelia sp. RM2_1_2]|nr:hypothetical protein [Richelia sp. RM2_1_2]